MRGRRFSRLVHDESGYLMAAMLVAMSIMAIMMSIALPAWQTFARREKEAELIFRAEQYARAIALYQKKNANQNPPNLDVLIDQRFLRKKYKDPITGDDFQLVRFGEAIPGEGQAAQRPQQSPTGAPDVIRGRIDEAARRLAGGIGSIQPSQGGRGGVGGGGIIGVVSKSTDKAFRLYNGRDTYNQWVFMGTEMSQRIGAPGGRAGQQGPGRTGAPGPGGPGPQNPFGNRGAQPGRGPATAPAPGAPQPPGGAGQRGGQRGGFGGRIFEN